MDAEILETKLFQKKRQISIMMDDVIALKKAAIVMRSIGYDDMEINRAISDIKGDIREESIGAVKLNNALEKAKNEFKELIRKKHEKN